LKCMVMQLSGANKSVAHFKYDLHVLSFFYDVLGHKKASKTFVMKA
jgi:hypothetical protein